MNELNKFDLALYEESILDQINKLSRQFYRAHAIILTRSMHYLFRECSKHYVLAYRQHSRKDTLFGIPIKVQPDTLPINQPIVLGESKYEHHTF